MSIAKSLLFSLGLSCCFGTLNAQSSTVDSLLQVVNAATPSDLAPSRAGLKSPQEIAATYHRLGNAYSDLGNLPAAAEATAIALEMRLNGEKNDADAVLVSAYNLGVYYLDLEQYEAAGKTFKLILDRAPNRKEKVTYFQLGRLYGATAEYTLAEQAFSAAEALAIADKDERLRQVLVSEWADVYLSQDRPETARRAIELLEKYLADADKTPTDQLTVQYTRLGLAHTYVGNYEQAETHYQRALTNDAACCNYDYRQSVIYVNQGLNYRRDGKDQLAEETQQAALQLDLQLAERKPDSYVATSYNNLATIYFHRKDYAKSMEYAKQALAWTLPDYTAENFSLPKQKSVLALADLPPVLTYLAEVARIGAAMADEPYDWQKSLDYYRLCAVVIDELHKRQLEEDSKLDWRTTALDIYAEAVATAQQANDPVAAFFFSEKSRATIFLDDQLERGALNRLPLEAQNMLQAQTAKLRFWRNGSGSSAEFIRERQDYERLRDSLEALYPNLYRFRQELPQPDLTTVQTCLAENEVLVDYFLQEEVSLALVATTSTARIVNLEELRQIDSFATSFRRELLDYATDFDPAAAHALHELLIAPLRLTQDQNVLFVPDGPLRTLPFAALLASLPEPRSPYSAWNWFNQKGHWSRAWSTQLHFLDTDRPTAKQQEVYYFAPASDLNALGKNRADLLLPLSKSTEQLFDKTWPLQKTSGQAALRNHFRTQADDYSLIHLATHAYLGLDENEPPYFLVADKEEPYYTAFDLLDHRFTAELITLSACETGLGEEQRGEGIASLGRSFARSGAEGIAFSLWPIDEAATVELLGHYYAQLSQGNGRSESLIAARKIYLAQQTNARLAHPFRWASFVYYGPDAPLAMIESSGSSRLWFWGWALLGSILFLGVVWLIKQFRISSK